MIGLDGIIHYFLTQIRINAASDSLFGETGTKSNIEKVKIKMIRTKF